MAKFFEVQSLGAKFQTEVSLFLELTTFLWHLACNRVVGWHGYLSEVRCRLAHGPADATTSHCLASVEFRLVLPFCYGTGSPR